MKIKHRGILASALIALALIASILGVSPALAQSLETPGGEPALESLSTEEQELFYSGDPAILHIDPATGEVLSVEPALANIQPFAVYSNCSGDRACWRGYLSPHIWYGFDGSGATGTWPNRGTFATNKGESHSVVSLLAGVSSS